MTDDQPGARTKGSPRIGPREEERYRNVLILSVLALPLLAGLYGLHRGGFGNGAAVGLGTILLLPIIVSPGLTFLGWLAAPRKPPLWPFERLYWSLTILIAAAIFVGVAVLIGGFDPIEEHGVDGWIDGLIAGFAAAWLFGIVAARLHAWLMWLKGPEVAEAETDPSRLQSALAETLAELEAVRMDAGRRIRRRAAWMTPAGAAIGVAIAVAGIVRSGDVNLITPPVALLIGAAAGHILASRRLAGEYERLYKARVLPRLAALFGGLTFERPPPPDLTLLRQFHVFRHFGVAHADDAIRGVYRGLRLGIIQLLLTRGWGLWRKTVFRGLLIEIELTNRLAGTTAIASDAGSFGNFRDELAARNVRRVGLESAAFEHVYEVYGTDQVMARTLITPDFMERFTALGKAVGFGRPLALAQDNLLRIALPRTDDAAGGADLFEAPNFEDPASDNDVLKRLHDNIKAVLQAADAVIGLDDATRAQATAPRRSRKPPASADHG